MPTPPSEIERISATKDPEERLRLAVAYIERAEQAADAGRAVRNDTVREMHKAGKPRRAIADLVPDGKLTVATVKSVTPR